MPIKVKKIPERKCTGCGGRFAKKDLVRVVRTPEGKIELDFTGKAAGRGAYVCPSVSCLKKARKARRFESAFECAVPDEVYAALEEEMVKHGEKEI